MIRKGQIVWLKPEYLDPGEPSLPHVALEDACDGSVKVEVAGAYPLPLKPVNDWRIEWIAEVSEP